MHRRTLQRALGALGLATALVAGAAGAAIAAVSAPTPDRGPTAGNTTVLVPEPASLTFDDASRSSAHALATGSDGQLYAWGSNSNGQLGDGTTVNRSTPVVVTAPDGVTLSEPSASYNWSVAIGSDGGVYAWGQNQRGKLGNGTLTTGEVLPQKVLTPAGVTFSQAETGEYSSWALGSDGQVYAWGRLVGTTTDATTPVATAAPDGATFTRISGGNGHILALASDGALYAWGSNGFGQLGVGSSTPSGTPVAVAAPAGVTFTDIAAGGYHSLALGSDGVLYAWGYNDSGQLGIGSTAARNIPTAVEAPEGVTFTDVSGGFDFTLANTTDGDTYGWGANLVRTVGDGTNVNRTSPVLVQTPAGVTLDVLAAGDGRSLAIGTDGRLYAWSLQDGSGVPALFWPTVVVTGITFDGLPGTDVTDAGDGDWSVVTPAHAEGPVDVVVEWTQNGVVQTPVTHVDGFTYLAAPTITDPEDRSTAIGSAVVFTATPSGAGAVVSWEYSTDGGGTWLPIADDSTAEVSDDGNSITVTPDSVARSGYLYRATAVSDGGSATSEPAELTVTVVTTVPPTTEPPTTEPPVTETPTLSPADPTDPTDPATTSPVGPSETSGTAVSGLAATGGALPIGYAVLGAFALLLGATLVHARIQIVRRRG